MLNNITLKQACTRPRGSVSVQNEYSKYKVDQSTPRLFFGFSCHFLNDTSVLFLNFLVRLSELVKIMSFSHCVSYSVCSYFHRFNLLTFLFLHKTSYVVVSFILCQSAFIFSFVSVRPFLNKSLCSILVLLCLMLASSSIYTYFEIFFIWPCSSIYSDLRLVHNCLSHIIFTIYRLARFTDCSSK